MTMMLVWERSRGMVEFPLGATTTLTVGREEDADIQIAEPLVSRMHARLERRGEAWFVIDLGSTNLTRVNGTIVREKELHAGDELQFARAKCRFLEGKGSAEEAPPGVASETAASGEANAETPRPMPAPANEGPSS
jgi:pSer/pThr/pTyr-binding forkhead associated (FHA) protein